MNMEKKFDAVMIVSFGGPEGMEDVRPFLENVLRGKNVPPERMEEVVHHYEAFGGVSPINEHNRELKQLLEAELAAHQIDLPVYWGNRNWSPYIKDAVQQMKEDGITSCLNYMTSGYSCYSGCRQYRENVIKVQEENEAKSITFGKIRVFYNHPNWIELNALRVQAALDRIPEEQRANTHIAFTAHSIPTSMSDTSAYVSQLEEACRLTAEKLGHPHYKLVYQSRSGPPTMPWLEPDICDHLDQLKADDVSDVVIHPIGFVSDHMEVLFDLDTEAKEHCDSIGLNMERSLSAGNHPLMVSMIRELIQERLTEGTERRSVGSRGPNHDVCPENCCMPMKRPATNRGGGRPGA